MTMPDRDVAVAWVGRTVIDRDGAEIGACTAVYADDATQQAEWVCSEFSGAAVLIPAVGAAESGGQVQVMVSREDVAGAPSVDADQHVSVEDELALYRHYGIPHSREESPSVLPTDEPGTATDEPADFPAPDAAPAQPAARGKGLLVSGGLAGLAAVGTVLAARRLRRRPKTRAERLADRGRAASAALTSQVAPVLDSTKQVVRRPGKTGAAVSVASALAALLAARRRRSSRPDPTLEPQIPAGYR